MSTRKRTDAPEPEPDALPPGALLPIVIGPGLPDEGTGVGEPVPPAPSPAPGPPDPGEGESTRPEFPLTEKATQAQLTAAGIKHGMSHEEIEACLQRALDSLPP